MYSEGWKANDMEMTYIYWMKFATLWIEKLRYHPEFMQAEHVERKGEIQVKCLEVLNRLEKIKADLKELYLKYQMWKTRQEHLRDLLKKKVEQREQERRLQEERNQEERDDEQIILEESEDDETEDESSSSTFSSLTTWSTSTSTKSEIREITIDQELIYRFLELVFNDTDKEIESCGLLAGKLNTDTNSFYISHLLLPKQSGTQNTCHSTNDEETGNYQIENGLQPLGWIHTHPVQDCFLSSVDLHMQYAHQMILPEAISIVCAPRKEPNLGIFNLSQEGYQIIKECRQGISFHPHLESNIYQVARHVTVNIGTPKYKVIDFRDFS